MAVGITYKVILACAPRCPALADAYRPHEGDHKGPLPVIRLDVPADGVCDLRQLLRLATDPRLVRGLEVAAGVAVVV